MATLCMSTSDIGFFDADDDERYALSSSDGRGSVYSVSEDARSVHSARAASVYETPQARSVTSQIAHEAKVKLIRVSPNGRRCLVTNETTPEVTIEAAHLLRRSTKDDLLTKLEFVFGLKFRQMHIDTTRNLVYFRVDHHRSFDNNGFLFLPERDVIEIIQDFTTNRKGRTYKQALTRSKFKYRLVPLQLARDGHGIFRRRLPDDAENAAYDQIFPLPPGASLPVIESHASPFFIIANAGLKLSMHSSLLPDFVTSDLDLRADIAAVGYLWLQWSTAEVPKQWMQRPYQRRSGGSGRDTRSGSSALGRDTSPSFGRRDASPSSDRRGGSNRSGRGTGRSGETRTAGDLPDLQPDDHSDSMGSEVLTEDAVQSVACLDRTAFLEKWLNGYGSADMY
ncbi:HNH endonuclease [Mycena venus]|uniref:HNH endonuclease n=1 Tax=Mycena venus TaxID=2733690 RepID=A0A8H6Z9U6_9AGAR|nr:HNH endonuclease [Mycena venus]